MANSIEFSLIKTVIHSAALMLAVALTVAAQGVGSSRGLSSGEGSNTIQGRVFFPPGEAASGKTIRLRLESNATTGNPTATTDQDGTFRFNSLAPGSYTVVVDGGKEYESTRESTDIELGSRGRIVQVTIQLKPKIDAANAAFAGVPKPALEFYQKGAAAAQKGDAKAAVEFLKSAVAAAPTFAMAVNDLGVQYLKLSQWHNATETYETLLKLKPNDPTAELDLGIALYNEGLELMNQQKFDDAEKKFNGCEAHL